MIEPKLELKERTNADASTFARTVATKFTANAGTFAAPSPTPAVLVQAADELDQAEQERAALEKTIQAKTLQIRTLRNTLDDRLTDAARYVDGIAKGNAEIITLAGMDTTAGGPTPVGPLPKVENLRATQGDEAGEIDLQWDPIRRGLKSYLVEKSASEDGQSAWEFAKVETKSKTSVAGLESGKRYWFRVKAVGAAGEGPASDITTKVAP